MQTTSYISEEGKSLTAKVFPPPKKISHNKYQAKIQKHELEL